MIDQDLEQEDEYFNRKYIFHVEVKNNIGIQTKFCGSQSDFDKNYNKHFEFDTYGKIIGVNKSEYIHIEESIKQDVKRNRWGEDISEGCLNRSNTNKRYWKYL